MKTRKSIKYICMTISIILIFISCINMAKIATKNTSINSNKEIYKYTNKFSYDYKVNLKENKFIPEKTLEMSQNYYVTDLIDNIDLNLKYSYEGTNESTIKYDYQIVGKLTSVYTKDGVEKKIWEREDVLKDTVSRSEVNKKININENLKLDLKDKNALVKEFEDTLGISVASIYSIMLKVNTYTNIEGTEVKNKYIPLVNLSLAEKVTTISGDNNLENSEYISRKYVQSEKLNKSSLVVNVVLFIIGLGIFAYSLILKPANIVRNEYRQELNRILRLCQDKIIKVSQNPNLEQIKTVDVNDFGEIVKASEELFKPILYWLNDKTDEAEFSVISNDVIYRYILKK